MTTKVVVRFTRGKPSKNCERYEAIPLEAQAARLRSMSMYLERSAFVAGVEPPREIAVTVQWE